MSEVSWADATQAIFAAVGALTGIFTTIVAFKLSSVANTISKQNIILQKKLNQPRIRAKREVIADQDGRHVEVIKISNDGTDVEVKEPQEVTFWEVSVRGSRIRKIYTHSRFSGLLWPNPRNRKGDIVSLVSTHGSLDAATSLMNLINHQPPLSIQAHPVALIRVDYTDVFGDEHCFVERCTWHGNEEVPISEFEQAKKEQLEEARLGRLKNYLTLDGNEVAFWAKEWAVKEGLIRED